jgi:hypothetical protein
MSRAGFEPATPATERPQSYALDGAVPEIGLHRYFTWDKPLNIFNG